MKVKVILGVFVSMIALVSCSTHKAATDTGSKKEQMVGAYTNYRSLSSDEKKLFDSTYNDEMKLTPQKVATQVVAGTNYSFICKGADKNTYEVIIYQPLPGKGNAKVSSIKKK